MSLWLPGLYLCHTTPYKVLADLCTWGFLHQSAGSLKTQTMCVISQDSCEQVDDGIARQKSKQKQRWYKPTSTSGSPAPSDPEMEAWRCGLSPFPPCLAQASCPSFLGSRSPSRPSASPYTLAVQTKIQLKATPTGPSQLPYPSSSPSTGVRTRELIHYFLFPAPPSSTITFRQSSKEALST